MNPLSITLLFGTFILMACAVTFKEWAFFRLGLIFASGAIALHIALPACS